MNPPSESLPSSTPSTPPGAGQRLWQSWQAGERPDLEGFLANLGPRTPGALLDLVRIDQRESWQHGERRPAEDYLRICPVLREHLEQILDLVYGEFLLREELGEAPLLAEYQLRFPELAEALQRQVEFHNALESWSGLDSAHRVQTPHREPQATVDAGGRKVPPAAPPVELPGYEIIRELGRGGMGVVFLARHKGLKRLVALKMMLAGALGRSEELERFRAEAEALARLQHPGIIQIYDIGEHEGRPYFSLEFAPGGSLGERLKASPQPPQISAALMEHLARVMHAAHQAGVVHRDFKPGNILLGQLRPDEPETDNPSSSGPDSADRTLDLKRWSPKITDFGLAKRLDVDSGQTRTGDIMGTPSYMASEQAQGAINRIGPCSDVYALGALLYELLTGRPPFKGESAWDTIHQVINEEPVPPSRLRPRLPRDLETICLKCLEKSSLRRYPSAAALADDLQRFREGRPIEARPVTIFGRGWKWAKRRPAVASLGLAATLLLCFAVGSIGYNLWQGERLALEQVARLLRSESDRSNLRRILDQAKNAVADGHVDNAAELAHTAVELIKHNPDLHEFAEEAEQLQQRTSGLAAAARRLKQFRHSSDEVRFHESQLTGLDFATNVERTRAAAHRGLKLFGLDRTDQTAPQLGPYFQPEEVKEIVAGCYQLLLARAGSASDANAALALLEQAKHLKQAPTRALHLERSRWLEQKGDQAEAQDELRQAEALQPAGAADFFLLGMQSYRTGKHAVARQHFLDALARQDNHFWARYLSVLCIIKQSGSNYWLAIRDLTRCADQRPDFVMVYLVRGFAHTEMRDFPAAEADFRLAEALPMIPQTRYTLHVNRGVLRLREQRYTDAVAEFSAAIRLLPNQYHAHLDLARAYQEMKQNDAALAEYAVAFRSASTGKDGNPRLLASLYRTRAELYQKRGDSAPALADYTAATKLDPLAADHVERGRLFLQAKQYAQALDALDSAVKLPPEGPEAHHLRALALLELKRPTEALQALDRCLKLDKPTAALFQLRGRVKALNGDYAAAIEDYTQAIALKHEAPTLAHRGWAYLAVEAPRLALRDFEDVVQLGPSDADGHNGRGSARVKLGQYRLAVKDAEEAIQLEPGASRVFYKASRVFAQAVVLAEADQNEPSRKSLAAEYQERSVQLLRRALEALPSGQRPEFWREYVQHDGALLTIHRTTGYLRMKADYGHLLK